MRRVCWWHKQQCPDPGHCKRVGNFDPPVDVNIMSLHRPNRFGSWAEEAHSKRFPGVPWDGIVADLGTKQVRERWANWGASKDGRQGPILKSNNNSELKQLCEVAGVRMAEPGEILQPTTMKDRLKNRSLRDYIRRAE